MSETSSQPEIIFEKVNVFALQIMQTEPCYTNFCIMISENNMKSLIEYVKTLSNAISHEPHLPSFTAQINGIYIVSSPQIPDHVIFKCERNPLENKPKFISRSENITIAKS
jgi:hypothetical protein